MCDDKPLFTFHSSHFHIHTTKAANTHNSLRNLNCLLFQEINEFLDTITMIRNTIEKTSALQRPSTFQTSPHMVPFAFSMKLQVGSSTDLGTASTFDFVIFLNFAIYRSCLCWKSIGNTKLVRPNLRYNFRELTS